MKQQYGLGEFVRNAISLTYTRYMWKRARLIRLPFYIRGGGYFHYGKGLTVGYHCRFEAYCGNFGSQYKGIVIGQNCKFGDRVHLSVCHSVEIGDNCLFASNILVTDNSHGVYSGKQVSSPKDIPDRRTINIKEVKIGNNCWIGENVVILPGITLGNGCVVGAGAIVTKSFPDNTIIAGNPAKVIKVYDEEQKKWIKANSRDIQF